ncbi:MAG: hypothetical protein LBH74_05500 [Nitrososphaerota archaeon]|jgi:hypothetical protein|nr:hypothetical protein [Nitrososphaerota archaeon]
MTDSQKKKYTPIQLNIIHVIKALKTENKTYSELLAIGIPQKTLDRIINECLVPSGAIVHQGAHYIWNDQKTKRLTMEEHKWTLDHSKLLIPALENIMNFSLRDTLVLKEKYESTMTMRRGYEGVQFSIIDYDATMEHLKSYQEIWKPLINTLEAISRPDEFIVEYNRLLRAEKFQQITLNGTKRLSFEEEKELGEIISKLHELEEKSLNDKIKYYAINKTTVAKIVYNINTLIRRIKHGIPLDGECQLCKGKPIIQDYKSNNEN